MKNYRVIEEYGRYTIGHYDEDYGAYILNDGIYQFYWWETREEAQAAANAYNNYKGPEWLGQHGYGNDSVEIDDERQLNLPMVKLYRLFGAVRFADISKMVSDKEETI